MKDTKPRTYRQVSTGIESTFAQTSWLVLLVYFLQALLCLYLLCIVSLAEYDILTGAFFENIVPDATRVAPRYVPGRNRAAVQALQNLDMSSGAGLVVAILALALELFLMLYSVFPSLVKSIKAYRQAEDRRIKGLEDEANLQQNAAGFYPFEQAFLDSLDGLRYISTFLLAGLAFGTIFFSPILLSGQTAYLLWVIPVAIVHFLTAIILMRVISELPSTEEDLS